MDSVKRLHGIYRAVVKDNRDPQNLRRLKLQVQTTGLEVTDWVWPVTPSSVQTEPPAIGQGVWVSYIGGDPEYPVWLGAFGTNKSKNKQMYVKPLADTVSLTGIQDVIIVNAQKDGTKELDLTDSLIAIANKEKSLQTTLSSLQSTVANIVQGTGLQGPQGTRGAQGVQGVQGPQGTRGAQGTDGSQGAIGAQGALGLQGTTGSGTQGVQGAQGFTGTQGSLGTQGSTGIGLQGVQGVQGVQGTTGTQGAQGVQGTVGSQGASGTGIQGTQGSIGSTGTQGSQGTLGTTGTQGVQGTVGTGTQGTQGTLGSQGTSGATASAPLTLTTSITTDTDPLTIQSKNGHGGTGFAGIATLTNTTTGATNPNKSIRMTSTGSLEIVDNAYSQTIFALEDSGNLSISGTYNGSTLGDTGWISVTSFNNSFSGASVAYRKINNVVHLRGRVSGGTAGQGAFVLPVGYRPSTIEVVIPTQTYGTANINYTSVGNDGNVVPAASSAWLSSISFPVG